jgi:OOP family OmpA-OmpF porin
MTNTTHRRGSGLALTLALCAGSVGAQDLRLPPGALQTFDTVQSPGAYALPIGPWAAGQIPVQRVEGRVEVAAWHIPGATQTPFQLAQPLRDTLTAAGFEILLDCRARACGGFDFRFGTLVLPAPEMFVDLTSYHFISAFSNDLGAVSILTSRDQRQGYIQIVRAGTDGQDDLTTSAPPVPAGPRPVPPGIGGLVTTLESKGHVILTDLVFRSGSTDLGAGSIASLDTLAAYLKANPARQILFVGHTDAPGSLDANRSVSLRRAQAAVTYLRDRHDVPADRIGAEGAGYLSPVATNLTPEGREANRRVEAVLISTD